MTLFEQTVLGLRGESAFFSVNAPVYISRTPGRLDLMGGNVDYTGGLVFQATIREATWAAVQRRNDGLIIFWNPQIREEGWLERVEFDLNSLSDEAAVRELVNGCPGKRWTAYVLGAFYLLRCQYPDRVTTGANVYLESEVPRNKGVSSSAAVEVAVMKAAGAAYGVELAGIKLAEACQWMENVIAESACGVMDQATSLLGDEGFMLPLLCQPCTPRPLVRFPEELQYWGVDSGIRHAVTGIEYAAARAAPFVGYRMICEWEKLSLCIDVCGRIPRYVDPKWNGYLSNIAPSVFRSKYELRLPETLSGAEILSVGKVHPDPFTNIHAAVNYRVRACTRYAIEENHRIELFVELARGANHGASSNTFRAMGELMFQSHWSYTECGLGCQATDLLVDLVRQECGPNQLFGAKITGGGAGGTVVVLGARGAEQAFHRVVGKYAQARAYEPYVFEGSSVGADRFGLRVLQPEQ